MYYTTQGLMTAADLEEIRRDYDLDLCGCCESGMTFRPDEDGDCASCGCPEGSHG